MRGALAVADRVGDPPQLPERLKAPVNHGGKFVWPPFSAVEAVLSHARELETASVCIYGRTLADLRRLAREELLQAAAGESVSFDGEGLVRPDDSGRRANLQQWARPICLTGHQPELFHPGVWLKNFANAELADLSGGTALHLIIDNDLLRYPAIRVPGGTRSAPEVKSIPYDQTAAPIPYECRTILDRGKFCSFGQRVADHAKTLLGDPGRMLIGPFWQQVMRAAERHNRISDCFSLARHRLERRWGIDSREVPLSRVCDGEVFACFVLDLIARCRAIQSSHNHCLLAFRQEHRIRSRNHPVSDLACEGDLVELPFWIWSHGDPNRRRLFVDTSSNCFEITDRASVQIPLPRDLRNHPAGAFAALQRASQQEGVRIRPRALLTTLFARLVLGDTFIHGIGGAHYDRLTDRLARAWFEIDLPPHFVVTGTQKLFPDAPLVQEHDVRQIEQRLRELRFHPETVLDEAEVPAGEMARVQKLMDEKREWIRRDREAPFRNQRHDAIAQVNSELQGYLAARRTRLESEKNVLTAQLRSEQRVASREYAFPLFSEDSLRAWLTASPSTASPSTASPSTASPSTASPSG